METALQCSTVCSNRWLLTVLVVHILIVRTIILLCMCAGTERRCCNWVSTTRLLACGTSTCATARLAFRSKSSTSKFWHFRVRTTATWRCRILYFSLEMNSLCTRMAFLHFWRLCSFQRSMGVCMPSGGTFLNIFQAKCGSFVFYSVLIIRERKNKYAKC